MGAPPIPLCVRGCCLANQPKEIDKETLHLLISPKWLLVKKGLLGPSATPGGLSAVSHLPTPPNVAVAAVIFHAFPARAGLLAMGQKREGIHYDS